MRKPAGVERLYVDFDSFFATAEQHLQPHLQGRPAGVIPSTCAGPPSRPAKRKQLLVLSPTHWLKI
jgi:hypothetical protein